MTAPNSISASRSATGLGMKIALMTAISLVIGICLVTAVGVVQEHRSIRASFWPG